MSSICYLDFETIVLLNICQASALVIMQFEFSELRETPKAVSPKRSVKTQTSWFKNETDAT